MKTGWAAPIQRLRSIGFLAGLLASTFVATAPVSAQVKGIHDDLAGFRVVVDVDLGSGAVPPEYAACPSGGLPANQLFGVNFTSGLAYADDASETLYGLEWNGGSGPDIYLYTLQDFFCASGFRVGAVPVGFTNLESLAYCSVDGFLYSQSFDFPSHLGQLVRIDATTGIGTAIGASQPFDVRITGMACDSAGTLWAVTAGHGGRVTELYTVDRTTGVVTLVGATGTPSGSLESLALDGGTLVAIGTAVHHLDAGTGQASVQGGTYDRLWAMAAPVPEPGLALGAVVGGLSLGLRVRHRTRRRDEIAQRTPVIRGRTRRTEGGTRR